MPQFPSRSQALTQAPTTRDKFTPEEIQQLVASGDLTINDLGLLDRDEKAIAIKFIVSDPSGWQPSDAVGVSPLGLGSLASRMAGGAASKAPGMIQKGINIGKDAWQNARGEVIQAGASAMGLPWWLTYPLGRMGNKMGRSPKGSAKPTAGPPESIENLMNKDRLRRVPGARAGTDAIREQVTRGAGEPSPVTRQSPMDAIRGGDITPITGGQQTIPGQGMPRALSMPTGTNDSAYDDFIRQLDELESPPGSSIEQLIQRLLMSLKRDGQ